MGMEFLIKRVPETNSRYPLRNRGGHGGSREHSAPAIATLPAFKVRYPCQLLPGDASILWKSNTVKAPVPRISLRLPSSSTAIYVTILQGSQLKSPSIPFC
eukprot:398571-Pelagomonas_calceolata.AAC.1